MTTKNMTQSYAIIIYVTYWLIKLLIFPSESYPSLVNLIASRKNKYTKNDINYYF
jgi:hypothetical protein